MKRLLTVVVLMIFAVSSLRMSCDPEELFDDLFTGFYVTSDGWEMKVEQTPNGFAGTVTRAGSQRATFQNLAVGGTVFSRGAYAGSPSSLSVGSMMNSSFSTPGYEGTATINGNVLTLTPKGQAAYTFTQSTSGSGTGGTTNPGAITLYNEHVSGSLRGTKKIEFTVPSGTKKLTVTTTELTGGDRNRADLFVRRGSEPIINHTNNAPYTWTADCAQTAGNRGDRTCSFNNPASGVWHAIAYGFNDSFSMQLIVTIEK